jgi:ketosteroid isomerase-like protein
MSRNVEVVERLIKAFEEGDISAALAELDPEVELVPIRAQLEGASYRGHDGYRRVIADFAEDWDNLRLQPERIHESGDRVVVSGRMVARGKASGIELDIPLGLLYELRDGKVVRGESFADADEALREAGISL